MRIRVREHMVEPDLVETIKKGLGEVEDWVASGIKPVWGDEAWLTCEISGVLDGRVTIAENPRYYDISDYEPENGEDEVVIPAIVYRLSAFPGYYDDDGKYLGDNGLDTAEFLVDIEVCPAGEDFHVRLLGEKPLPLLSETFGHDEVGKATDAIVDTILKELHRAGLSD